MKYYLIGLDEKEARLFSESEYDKIQEVLKGQVETKILGELDDPKLSEVIELAESQEYVLGIGIFNTNEENF